MRANIQTGSVVQITKDGRQISGRVVRVLNRPNLDGSVDSWNFWDLEYDIIGTDRYGRWKQNLDGGTVTILV